MRARLSEFETSVLHFQGSARQHLISKLSAAVEQALPSDWAKQIHAMGSGLSFEDPQQMVFKIFVHPGSALSGHSLTWRRKKVEIETLPIHQALHGIGPQLQQPVRPFFGGVSIGPLGTGVAGTLGCLLQSAENDEVLLLSNNHVLTDSGRLSAASICQPAPADGGTSVNDVVGVLAEVLPLHFDSQLTDYDAATAKILDPAMVARSQIRNIEYAPEQIKAIVPGMAVTMSGRTSGVTVGTVKSIVRSARISYGGVPPKFVTLRESWLIEGDGTSFAAEGDSGALVVERGSGAPVAMIVSARGTQALATELMGLCKRLNAWPI
jgi:hypothetical protein